MQDGDARADAERAASYVVSHVLARAGSRQKQGRWSPPLTTEPLGPSLDLVATTRLCRVSLPVARALVAWGAGERRVRLLDRIPLPMELLVMQAEGERCVSLLDDGVSAAPHEDGLAFAMHDLCHLEKFVEPEHHVGQVGFFRALCAATREPGWSAFVGQFDPDFVADLEHVVADMNGSAVFLFAALKMKLKMAVRRRLAREERRPGREMSGPLDEHERRAFAVQLGDLLDRLGLHGPHRDAALAVSTRRDDPTSALAILRYFEALGAPRCRAIS
jgi:hypothetical protein